MMNVCTHAGLSSKPNRFPSPDIALRKPALLLGLGLLESGEEGGESGGAGSRVFDLVFLPPTARPASRLYGVRELRRRPAFRASSSFSSSSISTSFISSLTPCSLGIAYPSFNIFAPNIRNNAAAAQFVMRFGISVGTACPSTAERMVMRKSAEKAAVKTRMRGFFMAMSAAMRKVLSPISEKIIIVRLSKKEWRGWIKESGAEARRGMEGVKGARIARGSDFVTDLGRG